MMKTAVVAGVAAAMALGVVVVRASGRTVRTPADGGFGCLRMVKGGAQYPGPDVSFPKKEAVGKQCIDE